jgi:TetR/AcrR family transcriptional regulator, cholesterol catabolism regulator
VRRSIAPAARPSAEQVVEVSVGEGWRRAPAVPLPMILAAALELFHERGFHGTSVRQIAARVGVTVPVLYYHYQHKDGILCALLDRSISHLEKMCAAALRESSAPEDRFLLLVECLVRYQVTNLTMTSLDAESRLLGSALRASYVSKRDRIEQMLMEVFDEAVSNGAFEGRAGHHAVRAVLGMVQGISAWFRGDGALGVDAVAALYVRLAARTVGANDRVLRGTAETRGCTSGEGVPAQLVADGGQIGEAAVEQS